MIYILLGSQSEHLAGSESTSSESERKLSGRENSIFYASDKWEKMLTCISQLACCMSALPKGLCEQLRQDLSAFLAFFFCLGSHIMFVAESVITWLEHCQTVKLCHFCVIKELNFIISIPKRETCLAQKNTKKKIINWKMNIKCHN